MFLKCQNVLVMSQCSLSVFARSYNVFVIFFKFVIVTSDKEIMILVASVSLLATIFKKLLTDCAKIVWRGPGW